MFLMFLGGWLACGVQPTPRVCHARASEARGGVHARRRALRGVHASDIYADNHHKLVAMQFFIMISLHATFLHRTAWFCIT